MSRFRYVGPRGFARRLEIIARQIRTGQREVISYQITRERSSEGLTLEEWRIDITAAARGRQAARPRKARRS